MVPVSSASGTAVDQEPCSLAATGQWEFRIVDSNDDFELYNPGTRLCLSVKGNSLSAGGRLIQTTCSTASDAEWHSSLDY